MKFMLSEDLRAERIKMVLKVIGKLRLACKGCTVLFIAGVIILIGLPFSTLLFPGWAETRTLWEFGIVMWSGLCGVLGVLIYNLRRLSRLTSCTERSAEELRVEDDSTLFYSFQTLKQELVRYRVDLDQVSAFSFSEKTGCLTLHGGVRKMDFSLAWLPVSSVSLLDCFSPSIRGYLNDLVKEVEEQEDSLDSDFDLDDDSDD